MMCYGAISIKSEDRKVQKCKKYLGLHQETNIIIPRETDI